MIKQMERHARTDRTVISLGQGIPGGASSFHIRAKVIDAIMHHPEIDRYSDPLGMPMLRNQICHMLRSNDMDYQNDEIMVTAGAIEGINAVLHTFIKPGRDEVLLPMPTYSAYGRAIQAAGGKTVAIPLDESNVWKLDIHVIEAAITAATTVILLCNPNNPTGTIYDKELLDGICSLALEHKLIVIIDEVYGNMVFDNQKLYSPVISSHLKRNVVRVVSFSKDFNLTGWRIGFLHSDESLIEKILPIHDTLVNCAPVISQFAASAALEIADETITANRQLYEERRTSILSSMNALAPWLSYVKPAGGYFLFPKLHLSVSAGEFCYDLLNKAKLITIPGDDFGLGGEQHIRLCFGRSDEDVTEGMRRLKAYLQTYHRREALERAILTV